MPELGAGDLAVVIPTRDRWPILRSTLDALAIQTVGGFDVFVVDDGSDEPAPELDGITMLRKQHAGPAAARNFGVRATDRRLVLFLGDDMIPAPRLIERHLDVHRRCPTPETAVLGRVAWHADVARSRLLRWLDWSASQFDFDSIDRDRAGFGHFYSCNVSLHRDFLEAAGGFDEDFTYYYEDLDLGWRLSERGMQLHYERDAFAQHLHSYEWNDIVRRFEGIARGERLMADKHAWFTPFFRSRMRGAVAHNVHSPVWMAIADDVPAQLPRVRRAVRRRANDWYYRRLEPAFTDAWVADGAQHELARYLGDAYDDRRLREHLHEVAREMAAIDDEATFYRTSEAYLYDLTVFEMSGTKAPYRRAIEAVVEPPARLLDYGCGIGGDGLTFLDDGYDVAFADFDNPSTRYLRWRLGRRGHEAQVFDLDHDAIPSEFDVVYSFDVIEHVDDPFAFLDRLEHLGRLVAVNFLEPEPGDIDLHRPLPIDRLLDHAADRGLLHHRCYHGRSHLVIYRSGGHTSPSPLRRRWARTWSAQKLAMARSRRLRAAR